MKLWFVGFVGLFFLVCWFVFLGFVGWFGMNLGSYMFHMSYDILTFQCWCLLDWIFFLVVFSMLQSAASYMKTFLE